MVIASFFVSMFILVGLISSRVFEMKSGKTTFLLSSFDSTDKKIKELFDWMVLKCYRYKKIVNIFIFDFLPSFLYELLGKTKDYVAKKYYEAGNSFRGKRVLKSNGSVSSFLEQLSEEKNSQEEKKQPEVRTLDVEKEE